MNELFNLDNKNILVLSPFNIFPPSWGGASRIYNLLIRLSDSNHVFLLYNNYNQVKSKNMDIDLNPSAEIRQKVNICSVESQGKTSQFFNARMITEARKIIEREKIDIIIAEFAWTGLHAIILRILTGKPYILDEHNIEFLRFQRMKRGNKLLVLMLKKFEQIACKLAAEVYTVSETDKSYLVSLLGINGNKIKIVPNMVDHNKFYPDNTKKEKISNELAIDSSAPIILFFGKLDYKPNSEAIQIIFEEILPRVQECLPEAVFLIVGDNPPDSYKHSHAIFTGMVDRIEDYINAADIVICPLISGGGTRIKILESLACDKRVISTSIGAEGIAGYSNQQLTIIDQWDQFVTEIVTVLSRDTVVICSGQ